MYDGTIILQRLQNEGLLPECPEAQSCDWMISDEGGSCYCTHPRNISTIDHAGGRVGVCSVGSCPIGALLPHKKV